MKHHCHPRLCIYGEELWWGQLGLLPTNVCRFLICVCNLHCWISWISTRKTNISQVRHFHSGWSGWTSGRHQENVLGSCEHAPEKVTGMQGPRHVFWDRHWRTAGGDAGIVQWERRRTPGFLGNGNATILCTYIASTTTGVFYIYIYIYLIISRDRSNV